MEKSSMINSSLGEEMYQDPKESEKHFQGQGKDFKRYTNKLLDFLPIHSGKLLDVGCGFGWVVAEAEKRGFDAAGIDEARPYITMGKRILQVNLRCISLEKFATNEKFDVITLNHVLEHIKKPDKFLTKIHKLLKPGGFFLVACPNIDSLMFWIFKDRWYGLQPAQHIWQFTGRLLTALLSKNGFRIDRMKINSLDYQPGGWKRIAFWILTGIANLFFVGDQVFVLARKK